VGGNVETVYLQHNYMGTDMTHSKNIYLAAGISFIVLASSGCLFGGGGSSRGDTNAPFATMNLDGPAPSTSGRFGFSGVLILDNGNIVVADQFDSSVAFQAGAVHLYSPASSNPIASIYGDEAFDQLGSEGITALSNNNFVVASSIDDVGGIEGAGSVRLVNGSTGLQIGIAISGDVVSDQLGLGFSGVTALPNNNYVVNSVFDDEGGLENVGSVRLVDGNTGLQIGPPIVGDVADDVLGSDGIFVLANNNYVIASTSDDEGGIENAGSVRLVDGNTGLQIGSPIIGDMIGDRLGSEGITVLANNNYVIASPGDDLGGIDNAGSVRLVDGSTGLQIGSPIAGDVTNDGLGSSVIALANNNYVIISAFDDEGGIENAGSVRLVDGNTGIQIGTPIVGNVANARLASRVTALPNNNYVITSVFDDNGSIEDAGSVRLIDGDSGLQIGTAITGDVAGDFLGSGDIAVLANNNYVIASPNDDEDGIENAGSVRLVNGSTGMQIGTPINGDMIADSIGISGVTALSNNNYVVASFSDDEIGQPNVGSIRLVNGNTGLQIGTPIVGDLAGDEIGINGVMGLANNNYVILSEFDNENGVQNAGSVRVASGFSGIEIGSIIGEFPMDVSDAFVVKSSNGPYAIVLPLWNNNGLFDSGRVVYLNN